MQAAQREAELKEVAERKLRDELARLKAQNASLRTRTSMSVLAVAEESVAVGKAAAKEAGMEAGMEAGVEGREGKEGGAGKESGAGEGKGEGAKSKATAGAKEEEGKAPRRSEPGAAFTHSS